LSHAFSRIVWPCCGPVRRDSSKKEGVLSGRLIVPPATADDLESHRAIQLESCPVALSHLEERGANATPLGHLEDAVQQPASEPTPTPRLRHRERADIQLVEDDPMDAIRDEPARLGDPGRSQHQHTTPGRRVQGLLDLSRRPGMREARALHPDQWLEVVHGGGSEEARGARGGRVRPGSILGSQGSIRRVATAGECPPPGGRAGAAPRAARPRPRRRWAPRRERARRQGLRCRRERDSPGARLGSRPCSA